MVYTGLSFHFSCQAEVEEYRKMKEMTIVGRNVPRPVKNFHEILFPGMKRK